MLPPVNARYLHERLPKSKLCVVSNPSREEPREVPLLQKIVNINENDIPLLRTVLSSDACLSSQR
jgi:hypothetical protein